MDDYDQTKVKVTDTGRGTDNGDTITWYIWDLATGSTGSVRYTVSIKVGVIEGTEIINNGTISGDLAEEEEDDIADNYYRVTSNAKVSPVANFTSNSPQPYCTNISFTDTTTGGKTPYIWYWEFGDGNTSTDQNTSHRYSAPGTYNVTLTVTDDNGCTNSTTKPVVASDYTASLEITKTANVSYAIVGTVIGYNITVNNTGNVNLTNVLVTDSLTGLSQTIPTLAPGASQSFYPSYTVMQADICAPINNTAKANATDPCANILTKTTPMVTVTTGYNAMLDITKVADTTGPAGIGEEITYTITVQNTGNITINNVTVNDSLTGTAAIGTLTAGESKSVNSSYTVTEEDARIGTVKNTANATGDDLCGKKIKTRDVYWNVKVGIHPDIAVNKTADPIPGDRLYAFTINVTNTGDCKLDPVKVVDMLPVGMSYVSSSPEADVHDGKITWNNVSSLDPGESTMITLVALINEGVSGLLINVANVTGTPPTGDNVTDSDTAEVIHIVLAAGISVNKTAFPTVGTPLTDVTFTIEVSNTGECILDPVIVVDMLPEGMSYVSDDSGGSVVDDTVTWMTTLGVEEDKIIHIVAQIDEGASGILINNVTATGTSPPPGPEVTDSDFAIVTVIELNLEKSASPAVVPPGGNVTYTINYSNTGGMDLTDVVITENYPNGVTFISASPAPDAGTNNIWTIGTLPAGTSGKIIIKVKVPESRDYCFSESGSVSGEGFVMINKDLSTEQKPYTLRNIVTLSCAQLPSVSAYASTTVSGVPGTSLSITESGSGIYASDENLNLQTKNKSIILKKSTNAEYQPTSFNFSDGFSVNFATKWKQDICSKNMEIGAAIRKKISDATYIDDETISRVDEDKSAMSFDSSFNGSLYIGARTMDTAISETYIGEFDVLQGIQIGKGPIPTPSPTPTPTWLPCPYNASQGNISEDAEPTP